MNEINNCELRFTTGKYEVIEKDLYLFFNSEEERNILKDQEIHFVSLIMRKLRKDLDCTLVYPVGTFEFIANNGVKFKT